MTGSSADHPHSILLITLSNIGDALMTTPVMEALHHKYPAAIMDIVTDARARELFEHCPYRGDIFLKNKQLGWRGTLSLAKRLRRKRYDLIVDLRTDGLSLLLRAKRRLTKRRGRPAGYHAVERHFGVIMQRENLAGILATRTWLTEAHQAFARQHLAELPGRRWLALGPGARWAPKCWPESHFNALVEQLKEKVDAVILLGSGADTEACRKIADSLALPCLDLSGKTGLLQSAALLAQSRIFVGNDSGLGHLAAAVGTPTVTVFGPGEPARYHPWHPQACWVQAESGLTGDVSVSDVARSVLATLAEGHR